MMDSVFGFMVKAGIVIGVVGGAIATTIAAEWCENNRGINGRGKA